MFKTCSLGDLDSGDAINKIRKLMKASVWKEISPFTSLLNL